METWGKKGRKSVVGMCVCFVCLLVYGNKIKMYGEKREREREREINNEVKLSYY